MAKAFHFLFFLMISMCGFYHAWAEDEVLIEHARAGFSMRPKMDAWSGITVHLSNPSNSVREFEVVIVSQGSKSGAEKIFCRRPVYMPPRTKRQERFYGLFSDIKSFEVELYEKGIRIARDSFPVKGIESNAPVFLISDESHGSYSFLSKLKISNFDESPSCVYSRPRDLPERWVGYDGIDAVVLGSFHHEDLNNYQVEALKKWVSAGGRLIISLPSSQLAGRGYNQYKNSFVEELSDIRILGVRKVTGLPAMAEYFKHGLNIDRELYLIEVFPGNSEVILSQGEVPLILTSSYGMGKVLFLAFDTSDEQLSRWEAAGALWTELMGKETDRFSEDNTSLADKIEPVLTEVVGVSVPGFNKVVIFLVGYLIVVILCHLIFMERKRPEFAWLAYLLIVPVGIYLFYQTGQVGKGKSKLSITEVSLTELPDGQAEGRSLVYLGLFSPHGLTASLRFGAPAAYGPQVSRAMPAKPLFKVIDVEEEDTFTLKDLVLSAGTLHTLSFNNIVPLGNGINASMTFTTEGLVGEITNRTGQDLSDCLLVYNRHVRRVGVISNGETVKVKMSDPADAGWHKDYSQRAIKARREVVREKIITYLFTLPLLAKPVKTELVFLGWFSDPVFNIDAVGMDEKKDAFSLLTMELPVNIEKTDKILIPKGLCDVEIVNKASMGLFYRGEWLRSQREGELIVDFIIPHISRLILGEEIKVYFQFESADMDVKLDAYNWQEERWVSIPVEKGTVPVFGTVPIIEGKLYLRDGKVRLRVKGTPLRKATSEGLRAGFWEIKDLDIEIKGTVPDGKMGTVTDPVSNFYGVTVPNFSGTEEPV